MDSCFFDVLHDSADDHVLTVRKRIDIDFDCAFQEVVDQHRAFLGILDRLFHVADDTLVVVRNHHGPSAKHIGRPHQHRVAHAPRSCDRLFHTRG